MVWHPLLQCGFVYTCPVNSIRPFRISSIQDCSAPFQCTAFWPSAFSVTEWNSLTIQGATVTSAHSKQNFCLKRLTSTFTELAVIMTCLYLSCISGVHFVCIFVLFYSILFVFVPCPHSAKLTKDAN